MRIMLNTNRLLSLDWDYFTGDCSTTPTHNHCGYCKGVSISNCRGVYKKLDITWREKEDRILKLKIYKKTSLFVAECHANIMNLSKEFSLIYDFDAHYDSYDRDPIIHCGNWIYHFKKLKGKVLVKPRTIDKVNTIFICHSSPWTPRCMDENFFQFIYKISNKTKTYPKFIGHRKISLMNGYKKYI